MAEMCSLSGQHRDEAGGERADAQHAPATSAMLALVDQTIATVEATEQAAQRAMFRRLGGPDMAAIAREAGDGLRIWRAVRRHVEAVAPAICPVCGTLNVLWLEPGGAARYPCVGCTHRVISIAGHGDSPSTVPPGAGGEASAPLGLSADPSELPAAVPDDSPQASSRSVGEAAPSIVTDGGAAETAGQG